MAKKTQPSVRIRVNRDGTMNIRSYGGVDLRKVLPDLLNPAERADEPEAAALAAVREGQPN